ncbi:MAG: GNAT family N-acetyltransferase [Anaerolineae bacterium]|nr:GNAT family N-acetyltransferase [Anaerolineae bacterium]
MNTSPSNLSAGQVRLRDVIDRDLPIFYDQQRDPEAARMAAFPSRDREAFMTHWAKILADESILQQTILFDEQVAGNIVQFMQDGQPEVGYWLGKTYWGRGIATRALAQLLEYVHVRPLYAHAARHNAASIRVLEKCGFVVTGTDTGLFEWDGQPVEEAILTLAAT